MENKAMLMTIRLWWFYLIYMGKKTKEVRLNKPRDFQGDVYLYVSKTEWKKDLAKIPEHQREFFKRFVSKVGVKFTIGKIEEWKRQGEGWVWLNTKTLNDYRLSLLFQAKLDYNEFCDYTKGKSVCYSFDITNLVKLDEPKEISEFKHLVKYKNCANCPYNHENMDGDICSKCEELKPLTRAPQSWYYVEEIK